MLELLRSHAQDGRVDIVPLPDDNRFWAIAKALNSSCVRARWDAHLVAFDPGETTGVAVWDPFNKCIYLLQLETKTVAEGYDKLFAIVNSSDGPEHVRYEDYRVYGHMTEQHAFQPLLTARMIGAIEVACHLAQVRWTNCLAMHAKTFWDDAKLKLCGLYNPGMKHARDAQRHLLRMMGEPNVVDAA
jgi:hypothetical protein